MTSVGDRRFDDVWSASAHGLLARDGELLEVREALRGGTRTAVVLGVAGFGKTTLLSAVTRAWTADDGLAIRVRGHATERLLGFSTLLDVLDAGEVLESSIDGSGGSIRACVSGTPGGAPSEALALRRDVHQWLLSLADLRPLLVVLDDAQWIDSASLLVLSFAANRLAGTEVSFLVASRSDAAPVGLRDHPVTHLGPLDVGHASDLLDRAGPALDPMTRSTIIERAAGNPLALLEFSRASGIASTGLPDGGADVVPAGVEAAFAADLPRLPHQTRALLLLAAAGAVELDVLQRALGVADLVELLEPAEEAGLVRVRGRRVSFRHPLARSTVYDLATTRERRAAHLRLAEAYEVDDDRRVWHRAAATTTPDESLAADLVTTSDRLLRRGAYREAVEAVVRASELTEDRDLRDERLLEGVSLSSSAGWLNRVTVLSDRLRRQTSSRVLSARAAHYQAFALAQSLRQSTALEALEKSLAELIALDEEAGWAALTTLASVVYQTGQRRETLAFWLEKYEALTSHAIDVHPVNAAARAWIVMALDPVRRPSEVERVLLVAPDALSGEWPDIMRVSYDMLLGATAWLLDRPRTSLRLLERANAVMERSGADHPLAQNAMALGQVQFDLGLFDDADRSGRVMIDIGEANALGLYPVVGRELRARVASVRGDSPRTLQEIDRLLAHVEPGQAVALETNLYVSRAHALLALRDHEAAYVQLRALFDVTGAPLHPHVSIRALGDLASAAVRVGRGAQVRDIVHLAAELVGAAPGERMGRVVARAQALVGDDAAAGPLFVRAVSEPGAELWPLEWANAQLDYGSWLRRHRRMADARDALRSAHRTYTRLGAVPRACFAENELRAAGVRTDNGGRPDNGWSELTGQEREIVLLAAAGKTNKEIGESLFLSPRTVGAHLYHAFPKLNVTSRNQLRDVVQRTRDDD